MRLARGVSSEKKNLNQALHVVFYWEAPGKSRRAVEESGG